MLKSLKRGNSRLLVMDFDGTVTEEDLLDAIARGFGDPDVYRAVEGALDGGRISLRDVITREFEPVRAPIEEVVDWVLENVRIRPGFRELVELACERAWRVAIVSRGFHELIEPVLDREGVDVELHANRVDARADGWRVVWQYDASCGACNESCKRAIVEALAGDGEIVYVGDGYSDRCAAERADLVFARRGLAGYLRERGVPFEPFEDFFQVAARLDGR